MNGGFAVDGAALEGHAREVDALADRLGVAADAGRRPIGADAYGVVGQVFAGAVASATGSASGGVARLAGTAAGVGDGIRAAARDYFLAETRCTAAFRGGRP